MVVGISVQGFFKSNEIRGNQFGTLVNQLEKGVLRVGARFSPDNGARLVIDWLTIAAHAFSVALHDALLQVRSQFLQVLRVGNQCLAFGPVKVVVPNA